MAGKGGGSAEGVRSSGSQPKILTPFKNAVGKKPSAK
jgi:hypothetical protein